MLPLHLDGPNLGRRHQQFNNKVKEVLLNKIDFDEIKLLPENSDVDRLFKIHLASKIQDINYITDTLKSGDDLYISKVLKCSFLYDERYSDVINSDFLHNNIFPLMSERMVKKTLTAISMNVTNARAVDFYTYCINFKRKELAKKFLIKTNTDFKMTLINNKNKMLNMDSKTYLQVIGNSFLLAEAYLQNVSSESKVLYELRYLYSVSDEQYLFLLEKYTSLWSSKRFGVRTSKDIALKHKDRILANPLLYNKVLNLKTMVKHLSSDDTKLLIYLLLPETVEEFWKEIVYYRNNKDYSILELISPEKRFIYLKYAFQNKYTDSEFEMNEKFYAQKLYDLMTDEQRSAWVIKLFQNNYEIIKKYSIYECCESVTTLDLKRLTKYWSKDDVKFIISALLPVKVEKFWDQNFYGYTKDLLKSLPIEERFLYVKTMYNNKYPNSEFEMCNEFCWQDFYDLMTVEQREEWALRQLQSNNEVFGSGHDYNWYKFVNFTKSFEEIKKLIFKTTDKEQRLEMLMILIRIAKGPNEIKTLLTYLYDRHINEQNKESFIEKIIESHNVFEFDETCWNLLSELLHSIEVYNPMVKFRATKISATVLLYHILHDIPLSNSTELSEQFIFGSENLLKNVLHMRKEIQKIPVTKHDIIYEKLSKILIERIKQYETNCDRCEASKIIGLYNCLNDIFMKTDYPEIIKKFIHASAKDPVENVILNEENLLKFLKKDSLLVNAQIPKAIEQSRKTLKLNRFLNKLKIYFHEDSAKLWLQSFMDKLDSKYLKTIEFVISSFFQLADSLQKKEIMLKYAPTTAKIEHSKTNRQLLYIQKAICRFSIYSRPPVALDLIALYLKGDYVHYCLPMFNFYAVNLPYSQCITFIESLLDAPVSVQKHGIRLVFKCLSYDKQKQLAQKVWTQSQNVSLRSVLFSYVYNGVCKEENAPEQNKKFEFLKALVLDLNEDDDSAIFQKISSKTFPEKLIGELFESAYLILHKMPDRPGFTQLRAYHLMCITDCLEFMREAFLDDLVQEFMDELSSIEKIKAYEKRHYYEKKCLLVTVHLIKKTETDYEKRLKLVETIWNKITDKSLRSVLFLKVYNDLLSLEEKQEEKFELLKKLMSTLNTNDEETIFSKISNNLFPHSLYGGFFEYVFMILDKMLDEPKICKARINNWSCIIENIDWINQDFLDNLVKDCVEDILIYDSVDNQQAYYTKKVALVAKYLIATKIKEDQDKKSIILKKILNHWLANWNIVKDGIYVIRKTFTEFINLLTEMVFIGTVHSKYIGSSPLFELVLQEINPDIAPHIYLLIWDLKLIVITEDILLTAKAMESSLDTNEKNKELAELFGTRFSLVLKEFIEKNLFFSSMLQDIINLLVNYIRRINSSIPHSNFNKFKFFLASSLYNFENDASHLIILDILLPESSENCDEDYSSIIDKIKLSCSDNVKSKFYQMEVKRRGY